MKINNSKEKQRIENEETNSQKMLKVPKKLKKMESSRKIKSTEDTSNDK